MVDEMKNILMSKLDIFKTDKFTFDEDSHTYLYNKKKFTSVTTFLKNFVKEFNTQEKSKSSAIKLLKKEGNELTDANIELYQTNLIREWEVKKERGCDLGSITHKTIEEILNGDNITPTMDEEALRRILSFRTDIYDKKMKSNVIPIAQEIRVFCEELGIAGTIDCLVMRLHKDGIWRLEIWDWKTNIRIRTDSDKNYNKLLPPFQKEWENELNKYSIQLNLYKLILASKGIFVDGECVVIHIPSDNEPKIYKCKDYIGELEMYFGIDYYTNLKNKYKKVI